MLLRRQKTVERGDEARRDEVASADEEEVIAGFDNLFSASFLGAICVLYSV